MVRAQLMGKAPASQAALAPRVSDDNPQTNGADAKSLASGELAGEETQAAKASGDEPGLPPDDFLQQLQASLRQDVSLVHPPYLLHLWRVRPSTAMTCRPSRSRWSGPVPCPGPVPKARALPQKPAPMPPGGPVPGSAGLTESAQAGLTQTEQAQTDPVQTGATAHGPLQSGLALGDVTQSNLARDALAQTGLARLSQRNGCGRRDDANRDARRCPGRG